MSEDQVNKWTINFSQAKIGLRNLEVLAQTVTDGQIEVVERTRALLIGYGKFADSDFSKEQKRDYDSLMLGLNSLERFVLSNNAAFLKKSRARLEEAKTQVGSLYASLGRLRSLKSQQYEELKIQLFQLIPSFLDVFDSFLTRFTLQLRLQQAEFYKHFSEALAKPDSESKIDHSVRDIVENWNTAFDQVMPAVEALKLVNPQPEHKTTFSKLASTTTNSVLLTPVKWIQTKVSHNLKEFKFSDPRKGMFNKPHQPSKTKEIVVAKFDFQGNAESDLSFKKGDQIKVVDRGTEDDPNWWCGELNGRVGLFPQNYVVYGVEESSRKEESKMHPDEYIPRVTKVEATKVETPVTDKENVSTASGSVPVEPVKTLIIDDESSKADKEEPFKSTVDHDHSKTDSDVAHVDSGDATVTSGHEPTPVKREIEPSLCEDSVSTENKHLEDSDPSKS